MSGPVLVLVEHDRGVPAETAHQALTLARAAAEGLGSASVEAVLIAGLTAVGVDKEIAVPSVFLFRLATFWLPVLPGWLAFHHLTRRGML